MFSNGIYFGTGFNHDLTPIGNYGGTKIKEHSFLFNFGWLIEFWKWKEKHIIYEEVYISDNNVADALRSGMFSTE